MSPLRSTHPVAALPVVAALTLLLAAAPPVATAAPESAAPANNSSPAESGARAAEVAAPVAAEAASPVPVDVAPADAAGAPSDLAASDGAIALPEAAAPDATRSPMLVEIRALLDRERDELAQLTEQFQQAHDSAQALAIQQQIDALKVGTELAILRAQAKAARAAGKNDSAREIEAAIALMTSPPVPKAAVERPAPATSAATSQNAQH